jgi:hypothetical protein
MVRLFLFRTMPECPICKMVLEPDGQSELFLDLGMKREILDLSVYCTNSKTGCNRGHMTLGELQVLFVLHCLVFLIHRDFACYTARNFLCTRLLLEVPATWEIESILLRYCGSDRTNLQILVSVWMTVIKLIIECACIHRVGFDECCGKRVFQRLYYQFCFACRAIWSAVPVPNSLVNCVAKEFWSQRYVRPLLCRTELFAAGRQIVIAKSPLLLDSSSYSQLIQIGAFRCVGLVDCGIYAEWSAGG